MPPPAPFTNIPTVYSPALYTTVPNTVMAPVMPSGPYMVEQGGAFYYYYGTPPVYSTPPLPVKNQQKQPIYKKKSTTTSKAFQT